MKKIRVPGLASERNRHPAFFAHAGPAGLIVLFTCIFFAPVLRGDTFSMVGAHMYPQYPWYPSLKYDASVRGRGYPQTDHAETFYPISVFATNSIHDGEFPLWFPFSFAGIPIVEHGMSGILYPPRLLTMLILSPIRQHDVLLFTHLLMAGLGMYSFLRINNVGGAGAVLGALVWELSGHNAFWLVMEHVVIASAWLPLMMLAGSLAIKKLSSVWAVVAGVAVAMPLLAGSLHYAYLNGLMFGAWYLFQSLPRALSLYRQRKLKVLMTCLSIPVLSLVIAAALSAACWLPLFQWLSELHREPLVLQNQLDEAFSLKTFIRSAVLSCGAAYQPETNYSCLALIGLPAILIAPLALRKRSALTTLGCLLATAAILTVIGVRGWLLFVRAAVPAFDTMHVHLSFYALGFSLAVLAGLGFDVLAQWLSRRRAGSLAALLFIGSTLAIEAWQLFDNARRINPRHPATASWLFPETPLLSRLREVQGSGRILPIVERSKSGEWTPPMLAGKVSAVFNLRSGSGYESLLPVYVARLWRTAEQGGAPASYVPPAYRPYFFHDRLPMSLLSRLSVGLLVTAPGVRPADISGADPIAGGALELIYAGMDGSIYRNMKALPRAHLVNNALVIPNPDSALAKFCDSAFDPAHEAILDSELPEGMDDTYVLNDSDSRATIMEERNNEVTVETVAPVTTVLVLNDSWAPGWRAYVDDVERPLVRTNYAFRGVGVPAGTHRVEFRYRPRLLLIGMGISATALATIFPGGLVLAGWMKWRFRKSG